MHFQVHKRRQTPAVIIVALIDVLIVLLIFLMVTTTFKQQPALKLALPESAHAEKSGADKAPLLISIDAKGNLLFGDDKVPVTAESLKARLVARAEKDPDVQIELNADKAAPFGQVVKVTDAAKEAKIKTVNALMKEAAE